MKLQKKFYVIYQITNNLNGKIYIGKHKTNNLDDDYFGSGKYLHNAFKKHGLENFTMSILFYLQNEDEMNLLEKMVVTKEFCQRKDTYNLNVGGDGGWTYVNEDLHLNGNKMFVKNMSEEDLRMRQLNSRKSYQKHLMSDPNFAQEEYEKRSLNTRKWNEQHLGYFAGENNPMFGHVYSGETIKKMHDSHVGEKNHMAQKYWIKNPITRESKTILKTEPIPEGWERGRYCKRK